MIRLRRLGDILLVTPAIRAVRLAYPKARLDVLTFDGFHEVLVGNPHIDEVLVLEPGLKPWLRLLASCRQRHYDIALDLQSSPRSAPFVLGSAAPVRVGWKKRRLRDWVYNRLVPGWDDPVYVARNMLRIPAAIGIPPPPDVHLDLAVSPADRSRAAALFDAARIDAERPIIALSAVAKRRHKEWLPERYAALADHLIVAHGAQLVFTSGTGELGQVRAVVARMQHAPALWNYGATTIHELGAIYERCHLWIGNDGGSKHVATAIGCPTIVIIRAGDERFWTDCADAPRQVAVQAAPGSEPVASPAAVTVEQVDAAVDRYLSHAMPRPASAVRPAAHGS